MNNSNKIIFFTLISIISLKSFAQNHFERLGTQALIKGDYKAAIKQLTKASNAMPDNANVLKMLGYSYFQNADYQNAISAYSNLILLKPTDYSAFYYRGKARLNIANNLEGYSNPLRDDFYYNAIQDFSMALELLGRQDSQMLEKRGISYKDYGIYKSYKIKKKSDKKVCIALLNNSINDFRKILTKQPLRKDIILLIEDVKKHIKRLK